MPNFMLYIPREIVNPRPILSCRAFIYWFGFLPWGVVTTGLSLARRSKPQSLAGRGAAAPSPGGHPPVTSALSASSGAHGAVAAPQDGTDASRTSPASLSAPGKHCPGLGTAPASAESGGCRTCVLCAHAVCPGAAPDPLCPHVSCL